MNDSLTATFEWQGEGLNARIKAHAHLGCRLDCTGHHAFKFFIEGELDKYVVREAPQPTICFVCGNSAGLTRKMLKQIIHEANDWARPHVEKFFAERELEKTLRERLNRAVQENEVDPDVWYYACNAEFDLLSVFRQEAGEDEERLVELFSGTWEEVILPLVHYAPPPTDFEKKYRDYRVFFRDMPFWQVMLEGEAEDEQRQKMAASFVNTWLKKSKRRFRTTGRLSAERVYNWFTYRSAYGVNEARYLLDRLIGKGPIAYVGEDHLVRTFQIFRCEMSGGTFYQLVVK